MQNNALVLKTQIVYGVVRGRMVLPVLASELPSIYALGNGIKKLQRKAAGFIKYNIGRVYYIIDGPALYRAPQQTAVKEVTRLLPSS